MGKKRKRDKIEERKLRKKIKLQKSTSNVLMQQLNTIINSPKKKRLL